MYALQAGDEEKTWLTYSELWRDHRVTRGGLDVLVLEGKVPFATGEQLQRFFKERGLADEFDPTAMYYDLGVFQVGDALGRLTGNLERPSVRYQTRAARTPLYQYHSSCPYCGVPVLLEEVCQCQKHA